MTRDDIIRMAREAGFVSSFINEEKFEHFAHLVAAPLQERIQLLYEQLNEAEKQLGQQYKLGMEAEREACRRAFDAYLLTSDPGPLRARGNNES
jgi:uncharacterized membrane protein YccC